MLRGPVDSAIVINGNKSSSSDSNDHWLEMEIGSEQKMPAILHFKGDVRPQARCPNSAGHGLGQHLNPVAPYTVDLRNPTYLNPQQSWKCSQKVMLDFFGISSGTCTTAMSTPPLPPSWVRSRRTMIHNFVFFNRLTELLVPVLP